MKLKDLAVDHPYYCSESNYYSNEASLTYDDMTDFLNEFEKMDIDMNYCFRWDVIEKLDNDDKPTGRYTARIFLMLQRKGIFMPICIISFVEDEVERFLKYISEHYEYTKELWKPFKIT